MVSSNYSTLDERTMYFENWGISHVMVYPTTSHNPIRLKYPISPQYSPQELRTIQYMPSWWARVHRCKVESWWKFGLPLEFAISKLSTIENYIYHTSKTKILQDLPSNHYPGPWNQCPNQLRRPRGPHPRPWSWWCLQNHQETSSLYIAITSSWQVQSTVHSKMSIPCSTSEEVKHPKQYLTTSMDF